MNMSSSHFIPALKISLSVKLKMTLEFVKNIHSEGVGLNSEPARSPAESEILMKINKLCFKEHYFKIVGN